MRIESHLTDETVLNELGARLARIRLDRDLTQRQLSEQAGVGRPAVQRLERGEAVTTPILIRVLRALRLLDSLDALIPEPTPSPVEAFKLQGARRQRASGAHRVRAKQRDDEARWRWGDER